MRNFVQRGDTLDIVADAEVTSGDVVVKGAIVGVSNVDAAAGETFALDVVGVFNLPKVAALALDQGELAYWDAADSVVTNSADGTVKLGVVTDAVANPSPSVNVRLSGAF